MLVFKHGMRLRGLQRLLGLWAILMVAGCAGSATPELATATAAVGPTETRVASPSPVPPSATLAPPTKTPPPSATATQTRRASSPTPRPSATVAASSTTAATATTAATVAAAPTSANQGFTPTVASVWNTVIVGTDNMSGTCSGPVTPVYGLVQITPAGDTLTWKNQEPAPYIMNRVSANVWQYSGPSAVGDGTVTMVAKFTSATTFELTRTFVASAEPECTHAHFYTGTFQWNS